MTELKTLKDLRTEVGFYCDDGVSLAKIKKEAIKWVKDWETGATKFAGREFKVYYELYGGMELFKHFFNITEDELNDITQKEVKNKNGKRNEKTN